MTALLACILFYLPLSLGAAWWVARKPDRKLLALSVAAAWLIIGGLTVLANDGLPFSGGGDDEGYYDAGRMPVASFGEAMSPNRYLGELEQPGYPMILSALHVAFGPGLMTFKLFNLCLFMLIAVTWYKIASLTESEAFGRVVGVGMLLLTPLWFYVFFLQKDMIIVFLQTLFLAGVVLLWKNKGWAAILLIVFPSLSMILFRSPLVAQNLLVVIGVVLLKTVTGSGSLRARVFSLVIGGLVAMGVLAVATNPDILLSLGIYSQQRVIGSEFMLEAALQYQQDAKTSAATFPILYIVTETAGLSPLTWETFDAQWMRGVLALPWLLFVVPFLFFGFRWLLREPMSTQSGWTLRHSRLITTPWAGIVLFALSSMLISWVVGDTTRWRIPDMPILFALALAGWLSISGALRAQVLLFYGSGTGFLFSSYYLFREL